MANEVKVQRISASYVPASGTGLSGASVDSVELNFEINNIPYAEVSLHSSDGAVTVKEFTAAMQLEEMAQLQEYLFGEREGISRVTVTSEGDDAGSWSFGGIPVGPTKNAGRGSVSNRIKLMGVDLRLNALRPYIYGPSITDIANAEGELENATAPDGDNIMDRLLQILKKRMEFFGDGNNTNLSSFNSASTAEMARTIHNANQTNLTFLEQVVSNSDEAVYESFQDLDARPEHEKRQLKGSINGMLAELGLTSDSNFFNTLLDVAAAFQLYYVPSMEGTELGRFRPLRTMTDNSDNEEKVININNIVSTAGDYNYGPCQQVLVQGVFQMDVANVDNESKSESFVVPELQASTIFVYPQTANVTNGNFRIVGPPTWLPTTIEMFEDRNNVAEIPAAGGWDIEDYISSVDRIHGLMENVMKDVYLKIVEEYASNIYAQVALASFICTVQIPLDMSWELGKRYTVQDSDGTVLFKGFLQRMSHNVSGLREGLNATTYLTFTHVEYSTFTL